MKSSILDCIGNTPLVKLNSINNINVYAKLEYLNPFGSIKDRAAKQIIEDAQNERKLTPKSKILEATSGNMGIALSAIANLKNIECTIIMPENMSEKRKKLISTYNAKLILTPAIEGIQGAINLAQKIIRTDKEYFYVNQFENFSSIKAHMKTTAPEIEQSLADKIDMIIAGIGTGGTISGLAQYFKNMKSSIKIIGVLPDDNPHNIPGIGAGFIPPLLKSELLDAIFYTSDAKAHKECGNLLIHEGIFAGPSSGAVFSACKHIAKSNKYNVQNIVMIFADSGERYI